MKRYVRKALQSFSRIKLFQKNSTTQTQIIQKVNQRKRKQNRNVHAFGIPVARSNFRKMSFKRKHFKN